jgi:O-glycosyl hydrolase
MNMSGRGAACRNEAPASKARFVRLESAGRNVPYETNVCGSRVSGDLDSSSQNMRCGSQSAIAGNSVNMITPASNSMT